VQVDVEVQRAAEALHQRHRAGGGLPAREAGLVREVRGEQAVDDLQRLGERIGGVAGCN
jgi:hypothetical protein